VQSTIGHRGIMVDCLDLKYEIVCGLRWIGGLQILEIHLHVPNDVAENQSHFSQINKLKVAPTMEEPTTNDVCRAVKRAVNRIVNEDGEMRGTCSSGENEWPVPNTCVTSGTSNDIAAKRTCTSTSTTLCSVLEDLSIPQQQSERNIAQSSYLYVYSTALQCASLDSWGEAESLLLLGASLEMMYQFGTRTVHQDHAQPLRTPLGELSTSSISTNTSTDGRALIHQAKLFVRSHLVMTNDEHIIGRSNLLAFILQKLPEKWLDRTYSRIEQYQAKYPEPCFPDSIRVILRNAASLEEETCYTVSYHWTVNMFLAVFVSRSGHGHNTFQFLLPSPNERLQHPVEL